MKSKILYFAVIILFLVIAGIAKGQPPLPPSNGHGSSTNEPAGAGAPVGSGVMLLITLSVAYGTKKIYNARKDKNEV